MLTMLTEFLPGHIPFGNRDPSRSEASMPAKLCGWLQMASMNVTPEQLFIQLIQSSHTKDVPVTVTVGLGSDSMSQRSGSTNRGLWDRTRLISWGMDDVLDNGWTCKITQWIFKFSNAVKFFHVTYLLQNSIGPFFYINKLSYIVLFSFFFLSMF